LAALHLNAALKWSAQSSTIFRNSPVPVGNGGHHGQVGTCESPRGSAVRGHVDRREPSPARVALVLIHEDRVLREALAGVIRGHPEYNLLAALPDVGQIRSHIHEMGSGVVLLNCEGGQDALGARLATAHTELPDARVIVMGLRPNQVRLAALIQAGARGFITRDAPAEDLFTTISEVVAGEGVLPPALTASFFTELRRPRSGDDCVTHRPPELEPLTSRERQVTECVERGLRNEAIALQLGITTHTVKSHMKNVLAKLGLHSRLQLAVRSRSFGHLATPTG
jgi:two-component system nitrate/nitrite response regulator NarL